MVNNRSEFRKLLNRTKDLNECIILHQDFINKTIRPLVEDYIDSNERQLPGVLVDSGPLPIHDITSSEMLGSDYSNAKEVLKIAEEHDAKFLALWELYLVKHTYDWHKSEDREEYIVQLERQVVGELRASGKYLFHNIMGMEKPEETTMLKEVGSLYDHEERKSDIEFVQGIVKWFRVRELNNRTINLLKITVAHDLVLDDFILKECIQKFRDKQEILEAGPSISSSTVSRSALEERASLEDKSSLIVSLENARNAQKEQMRKFREGEFGKGEFEGSTCGSLKVPDEKAHMIERERQVVAKLREYGRLLHTLATSLIGEDTDDMLEQMEHYYDFDREKTDRDLIESIITWGRPIEL